jgi:predicted esterase
MAHEDEEGMQESVRRLNELILSEAAHGVDPNRIILGGFSQGGVMTLLTGLSIESKLGGLAVLSGRVPLMGKFKEVCRDYARFIADPADQYNYKLLAHNLACDADPNILGSWDRRSCRPL